MPACACKLPRSLFFSEPVFVFVCINRSGPHGPRRGVALSAPSLHASLFGRFRVRNPDHSWPWGTVCLPPVCVHCLGADFVDRRTLKASPTGYVSPALCMLRGRHRSALFDDVELRSLLRRLRWVESGKPSPVNNTAVSTQPLPASLENPPREVLFVVAERGRSSEYIYS